MCVGRWSELGWWGREGIMGLYIWRYVYDILGNAEQTEELVEEKGFANFVHACVYCCVDVLVNADESRKKCWFGLIIVGYPEYGIHVQEYRPIVYSKCRLNRGIKRSAVMWHQQTCEYSWKNSLSSGCSPEIETVLQLARQQW